MKKYLIGLVAAAVVALSVPAWAEVGTQTLNVTNTITKNATELLDLGGTNSVPNQDNIGIQLSFIGDQAGTGALTFKFARSLDGTTWETTPSFALVTALNGRTAVAYTTNWSIGAFGYYKLQSVVNADANAAATNVVIKIGKKTIRPSP